MPKLFKFVLFAASAALGMGWAAGAGWAAPSASYFQCVVQELPAILARPQVHGLVVDSLSCFGPDQAHLLAGAVAAKSSDLGAVCANYSAMSPECKAFSHQCNENRVDCRKALEIVFKCVPFVSEANQILTSAGIDSADILTEAQAKFDTIASSCVKGAEYVKPQRHLFWQQACDDSAQSSMSFFAIKEAYYDISRYHNAAGQNIEAAYKTDLLVHYALEEASTENWQRVISSMIGLESMGSDDPDERAAAATVLGVHGDFSAAVKFSLLLALNDDYPSVRAASARALRTQGDRKPLVALALLAKLLDRNENSQVRGQVAVALREQAVSFSCQPGAEIPYEMDDIEDPAALHNGIPTCAVPPSTTAAGGDDYFFRMTTGTDRCASAPVTDPTHSVFDKYASPDALKDFSISQNLCYHQSEMSPGKLQGLATSAMFIALDQEQDPTVKAQLVASLRTLAMAAGQSMQQVMIDRLRYSYLVDDDYRIRQAAIFALAAAAHDESWMLDTVIPTLLATDRSAQVRRAAIAALSEIEPPSLDLGDTAFQSYNDGRSYLAGLANDCRSVSTATLASFSFPSGANAEFFAGGFGAEKTILQASLCPDRQMPRLVASSPQRGASSVDTATNEIVLNFADEVRRADLEKDVILLQRGEPVPLTISSYAVAHLTPDQASTEVHFKIPSPLKIGELYQIKILAALPSAGGAGLPGNQGLRDNLNLLFRTTSGKAGQQIFDMMQRDPSVDVQYAAAEAFLDHDESMVIDFLLSRLRTEPASTMARASAFLMSPYVTYLNVSRMDTSDQLRFVKGLLSILKEYIDRNERLLSGEPAVADYLAIPVMQSYYRLINSLLEKPWLDAEVKKKAIDQLALEPWLRAKLSADFPLEQRTYSDYERIYYGPLREQLKALYQEHLLKKDSAKPSVDYVIYEKSLMHEDKPNAQ